ncbi:dihydrodipicolinate synthase family protein [Methyloterricola oryzae]|uniref:dihydrodipicolinate synthase family protein n=1 Tax=Methyloterricola oryzae TaxID=1495050 RepID=UPI0013011C92|nr:dihydrodipicolinate synthase family protein [Methyloterricola oryzae]
MVRGLWCASLTPLSSSGQIDCPAFESHIRDLLARGVQGVTLFGTTGEGPSFSVRARAQALEQLLSAGLEPSRIVVATGCTALEDTVALTRHALECGCSRCLVIPAFFWKAWSDDAVFRYYASLIETVNDQRLRLYLYHIPQLSGVPIPLRAAARLAGAFQPVIAGVKDSGADLEHTLELIKTFPDLAILAGHEPHLPELMKRGCAGTICGMANLWPELIARLLAPEVDPADRTAICRLMELLQPYAFVSVMKALLASQPGADSWQSVRPPLLPLDQGECAGLVRDLARLGLSPEIP